MLALTSGTALVGLMQNPFAAPYIERGAEDAAQAIERAFRATFTPDWLTSELGLALARDDRDRALWLAGLAQAENLALPADQAAAVAEIRAEAEGWMNRIADCSACAMDPAHCRSVAQLGACLIPFEMSPLGDVNALRRNGMAALGGGSPDLLESGLALAGLGATAVVLASGGTSVAVKAGATVLRVARRAGSLTPGFTHALEDAADLPVDWAAVARAAPLDEITDTARLARLGAMAGDVGTMIRHTSAADTLVLLRHVESAGDAAQMARLTRAAGPRAVSRLEVLGKSRSFRALVRVSDLALATVAALVALAVQLAMLLGGIVTRRAFRPGRPRLDNPAILRA